LNLTPNLLFSQQSRGTLAISRADVFLLTEAALSFRTFLFQYVAPEGTATLELSTLGKAKAFRGASMSLHLRHFLPFLAYGYSAI
jgi:hypothetical protein